MFFEHCDSEDETSDVEKAEPRHARKDGILSQEELQCKAPPVQPNKRSQAQIRMDAAMDSDRMQHCMWKLVTTPDQFCHNALSMEHCEATKTDWLKVQFAGLMDNSCLMLFHAMIQGWIQPSRLGHHWMNSQKQSECVLKSFQPTTGIQST